eukprot:1032940-Amphidinium_carterae.1
MRPCCDASEPGVSFPIRLRTFRMHAPVGPELVHQLPRMAAGGLHEDTGNHKKTGTLLGMLAAEAMPPCCPRSSSYFCEA